MKILDCTLRDGGYYTSWDFNEKLTDIYFESCNSLPVDYLEIGYRNNPMKHYLGQYFYCPVYLLKEIREKSQKKLVIILDEKNVSVANVESLLLPCVGLIDMVRIAIDPSSFSRALILAEEIKKLGFEIGFNVMYMSKWKENNSFLDEIKYVGDVADYFYMVDSYGGVYPSDVKDTIDMVRERTDCKLGFHGHNNLELALINSLTAIDCGAEMIDATITGMGRGAGNVKTELLLTALNAKMQLSVDFDALSNVTDSFEKLQYQHGWGTNLPYMVSGANSLPQNNVMDWVTKRTFSFNSIIRALQNQKLKIDDNKKLPVFSPAKRYTKVLIIGGGTNAVHHSKAIKQFLKDQTDICLIHASSKNANYYQDIDVEQFFCLVGNEGHRMEKVLNDLKGFTGKCILPPFPRLMGTYIPPAFIDKSYELDRIDFFDMYKDSHTALALQTALDLGAKEIIIAGYDGYLEGDITQQERLLTDANETLFNLFNVANGNIAYSITPTNYKSLPVVSIYSTLI